MRETVARALVDAGAVDDVIWACSIRSVRSARHGADRLVGRRAADVRAGRDDRPAVRLIAAGRALRRAAVVDRSAHCSVGRLQEA